MMPLPAPIALTKSRTGSSRVVAMQRQIQRLQSDARSLKGKR
jgi:hypothetical protein